VAELEALTRQRTEGETAEVLHLRRPLTHRGPGLSIESSRRIQSSCSPLQAQEKKSLKRQLDSQTRSKQFSINTIPEADTPLRATQDLVSWYQAPRASQNDLRDTGWIVAKRTTVVATVQGRNRSVQCKDTIIALLLTRATLPPDFTF
jgi:hypothetical protein